MSIQYISVWNVVWEDENNEERQGTALFASLELAEQYIETLPTEDNNTYRANELFVITEM